MRIILYTYLILPFVINAQFDSTQVELSADTILNMSVEFKDTINEIDEGKSAEIFVSNNFNNQDGLVVKWITSTIYGLKGYDLYRREVGKDWVKLNETPISLIKKNELDSNLNNDEQGLYNFTVNTNYDEFQKSFPRVFVLIKSIYNNYMANLIGIIYYDKTAIKDISYQYKLLNGNSDYELAISETYKCGNYVKESPPDSIKIERFKKRCDIKWKPDINRYYGVDIYRKTNDSAFRKITITPRAIQKSEDQKGNLNFPEVCYVDEAVNKEYAYSYKFIAINYFGQPSIESEEIFVPKEDFDPPEKPFNLVPVKHDSKMTIDLTWDFIPEEDLLGFNLYRSNLLEGPYEKINFNIIPNTITYFNDKVNLVGDYYYYCSTIDFSGNESYSGKIYLQIHDMFPPDAPKNLQSETGPGFINLTWDNNTESDLKGYFIQRSLNDEDNSDNHFININSEPTIENLFSEKLSKNVRNKFVYRIIAVDTSFNRSKPSINSLAQMPDVTPPNHPVIKSINFKDKMMVIYWIPNIESDLEGYNLFRKLKNDSSDFKKVNNLIIPKDITSYRDRLTTPGKQYLYLVKAIDVNGNISLPSKEFFGYNPKEKLSTKLILNSTLNKKRKKVTLSWNLENSEIPLQGSIVLRSTDDNVLKPYTKLIQENSFIDNISPGKYNYQIRTYTKDGLVIKSEVINIELIKTE